MFEYQPHILVNPTIYLVTVWFFICLIKLEGRVSSLILFLFFLLNCFWVHEIPFEKTTQEYLDHWLQNKKFLTMLDAGSALVLTMFMRKDKRAAKLALIMSFAATCHLMILFDYTLVRNSVGAFFYSWYDELIIISNLMLMAATYDRFVGSLSKLQGMLYRFFSDYNRLFQSLSARKERKVEKQ